MKLSRFLGINNVLPGERLADTELAQATNVDIGNSGEIRRRQGYVQLTTGSFTDVWDAPGFSLAVRDGDLVAVPSGAVVRAGVGTSRMWFADLPDGRVVFSNGVHSGITDGVSAVAWGVPVPPAIGAITDVVGGLDAGDYQYQITYVRLADGRESGPAYSNPVPIASGGILLTGLPVLADHIINVYITGAGGDTAFFAGSTSTANFSYIGDNVGLTVPCRTEHMYPAPAGTIVSFWRGRSLVAAGSVLYASRAGQWELFDLARDFKQFGAPITMVQPVDTGIWVGTTEALAFLAGDEFDKLVYVQKDVGGVALGSGVTVPGEKIRVGQGFGDGTAAVCVAGGFVWACLNGGSLVPLTQARYRCDATELTAAFREVGGVPQYVATAR